MTTPIPSRPDPSEYAEYFETYIRLVPEDNILDTLANQFNEYRPVLDKISAAQAGVLHASYTWTIRQVVGHMVDTERVFGYRAARFAASDNTSLPGFDQDKFVANTDYEMVSLVQLTDELDHIRHANIAMFQRMSTETWQRAGLADNKRMSVRAAAYVLVGHIRHHMRIIEKRIAK